MELHRHEHSHRHAIGHESAEHDVSVQKSLLGALAITIVFMVIEVIGGYVANSLALLSDAAHMLTDVGAILLSLFAFWVSRRPSTPKMSFGYQRAEILGALASGLIIWGLCGVLVYEAVLRISSPPEVKGPIVFIVAAVGLVANFLSMRILQSTQHADMNVRGAYLHMVADALGSIGAVIAGAVIWFTHWYPIDPIVTIFFALLMLISSWGLIRESIAVLMESTPRHVDSTIVMQDLRGLVGVIAAHDLHIWTVASGRLALSVHLISMDQEKALSAANEVLRTKHGIIHTTIQVEHPDRFDTARCYDCAGE